MHSFASRYGKTRDGVSCSVLRKVAAPWGRGDLSAVASGYSISGFAIGPFGVPSHPNRNSKGAARVGQPILGKSQLDGGTPGPSTAFGTSVEWTARWQI